MIPSKAIKLLMMAAVAVALFCAATAQAAKPDNPGGGNGGGGRGGNELELVNLHPTGYDDSEALRSTIRGS